MSLLRRALRTILAAIALASSPLAFGSAQIVLTVNPSLSPSAARLLENTAGGFRATAIAGPNSTNVTALVRSWTSSNTAVATIDSTGHVTAKSPGSTTVTATLSGSVRGSTVLTVTAPANPVFTNQPADTFVSAIIDAGTGVKVLLTDNLADPLPGLTVTMSIGTNGGQGGAGVLSGTLSHTSDSEGVASFADLTIDWLGAGYTLVATVATPTGPLSSTSNPFNETRVGDPCLGTASPACRLGSSCADNDGDGLNDAWEMAGGIDLNGNGVITDANRDLLLAGADPNNPDIYVYYDWMDYGQDPDETCATNFNCRALGMYHAGETCNSSGRCVYACTSDADCTSRTPATAAHAGERCSTSADGEANVCLHTHDPLVLEANTFQPVIDRFAAHGINLHILRGKAQPHSHVVSYRNDAQMDANCEGGSLAAGNVGLGHSAVSIYDLKGRSNPDTFLVAYHYALFGHTSGCDRGHCPATPGNTSDCPDTTMVDAQTGLAELEGNDLIISMGAVINNAGLSPHFVMSGAFMHELGHNLGMHHDGHKDEPCPLDGDVCPAGDTCNDHGDGQGLVCHETVNGVLAVEEPNFKPNYISIMNYRYQRNGIPIGAAVGARTQLRCTVDSDCGGNGALCIPTGLGALPSCSLTGYVCQADSDCTLPGESCLPPSLGHCARLDYSAQTLPTGGPTPGALDESNLDDTVGLGSGTADMFTYTDALCHTSPRLAPTTGPVNWGGDGVLTDPSGNLYRIGPEVFTNTSVQSDIDTPNGVCDSAPHDVLHGNTDWPDVGGLPFVYTFQCNSKGHN